MSELTDLVIQLGQNLGWDFLLFGFSVYELFCPGWLHPHGGTKLQRLLKTIPEPIAIILESISEEIEGIDEESVRDILQSNDYETEDFKDRKERRRPADD